MSIHAPSVVPPFRPIEDSAHGIGEHALLELEAQVVFELATRDDLASGMAGVVAAIRRATRADRVEWWAPEDQGAPVLVAAVGSGRGRRENFQLGDAGVVAVFGGRADTRLASVLAPLAPLLRRRRAEERLMQTAIHLARRNEALEDFAALVAHELKTPLLSALTAEDASSFVEQALDVVDGLLEAERAGTRDEVSTPVADSLDEVVRELGADNIQIKSDLQSTLPLPRGPFRVILRNLIANAAAAGARHVHVTAAHNSLLVDDDGIGLAAADGYKSGSGLGFGLSRRIAERFGGSLELSPRESGGTRAALVFADAAW